MGAAGARCRPPGRREARDIAPPDRGGALETVPGPAAVRGFTSRRHAPTVARRVRLPRVPPIEALQRRAGAADSINDVLIGRAQPVAARRSHVDCVTVTPATAAEDATGA